MGNLFKVVVCLAGCLLIVGDMSYGLQQSTTYQYDFTHGSAGWTLDENWSLGSWAHGGQALVGELNGVANHTEGSGTVRKVTFRFQIDEAVPYFCFSFGGPGGPAGQSYTVCIEAAGVGITSRQNEATSELAFVPFSTEGGLPHSVTVLTGEGSLDVFIDEVGVVGVDTPDPAPGSVSLLAGPTRVIVDDVEIVLGGDGAGHDRAPRPVEDVPPGPDVGPFVNGRASGDITLSGSEHLELSGGSYIVADGNITITGNASLAIAEDAVLAFEVESSPLLHFGIHLSGSGRFEVNGGRVTSLGAGLLVVASAAETSSIELRNCAPWIHIIQIEGGSTLVMNNVRLVTMVGGQIAPADRAQVDVSHSVLASIGLNIPDDAVFRAQNLGWGELVDDFDLRRDLEIEGIDYDLRLFDVVLHPSSMTDGANEKGWIVAVDGSSTLELSESEIGKLNLGIAAGSDEFRVSGLRIAEPADFSYRNIDLENVTVTQQWGFFIFGDRRAVFEDSEGVWLFPFDEVDAVLRRTVMSEFDPRDYTGTVTFEDAEWESAACEIIDNNDFTVRGSVDTTVHLRGCSWSESVMHRIYDVVLFDGSGSPVPNAALTATRDGETKTATTDDGGAAVFTFAFDDEDRLSPWTITGPGEAEASVDAFGSSPIELWAARPAERVRRGGSGRVVP
jgi:hypothetical protein